MGEAWCEQKLGKVGFSHKLYKKCASAVVMIGLLPYL